MTLRSRYGIREQMKLGLTTSKKRGPSGGEGEIEGEEATGEVIAGADALVTA